MFYNLLIQPLILIIDLLFVLIFDYLGVPGVTVIFLSIAVNLLALPLYRQADRIQKEERRQQEKMKPWAEHIKKAFSGDEQYMMLSAYYKVEHYSPASILKESFPLLLQVPIFMAAYRYLSSSPVLTGAAFGPVTDLGSPDGLLSVAGITINVLPVLMTALNLASGLVYSGSKGLRLKIQVFGLAMLFLMLLYNSPSGLVLYWTASQVFSLIKNLILETDIFKKRKVLLPLSVSTIFIVLICTAARIIQDKVGDVISEFFLILALLYLIHVILDLKGIKLPKRLQFRKHIPNVGFFEYIAVCICLFLLFGLCIPTSVLSASATEFIETATGSFQWFLFTYPLTVYAGLFLVWMSVYFYFSGKTGRRILFVILLITLGASLINYFAFDMKPRFYYTDLTFDGKLIPSQGTVILNIAALIICTIVLAVLFIKKRKILRNLSLVVAMALLILGVYHVSQIPKGMENNTLTAEEAIQSESEDLSGVFSLSKTQKNVVVLMLDRAIGSLVPYVFDEFPEFKDAFDGFTYYPNTVSFATLTRVGAPPLYGGYEYTPKAIAEDKGLTDIDKMKEAFRVLPVLFSQRGYDTTVSDPALFGTSLYDDYSDIKAYNLTGRFSGKYDYLFHSNVVPVQMRNFLVFSIYKTAPIFWRDYIYDDGEYMQIKGVEAGYTQAFIDSYSTLVEFPNLTAANGSEKGSFLFLQNTTTHDPAALNAPDYEIDVVKAPVRPVYGDRTVNGRVMKMNDFGSWKTYCVNVVAYRELVHWFDKLKELGVYDNTKIILVADHGAGHGQFDDFLHSDNFDVEAVNPLLMVKNFNSRGSMRTDNTLMSNADVATLATENVLANPTNPFTGMPISSSGKEEGLWIESGVRRQRTGLDDDLSVDEIILWTVHDSIFDPDNWQKVEVDSK